MNEDAAALSGVQESICEFMIKLKQAIGNEFKTFSQKAMLNLFKIATSLQSCGVVLLPQLADYVNYKPIAVQSKQIIAKDDVS